MNNKTPFLSLYDNIRTHDNKEISIDDYISFVRAGFNQDLVLHARASKQKGDIEHYKLLKESSKLVTGSCTFVSGVSKSAKNISSLNGLIVIDIDNDQVTDEVKTQLQNDSYTYIMHESFGGGQNYCLFVKIDSNRFEDSFENLAQYYFDTYGIKIDIACKNKNRLRFVSYDPNIFVNEKALKWKATKPKQKEVKKEQVEYIFFGDDFDNILEQIKNRSINLCNTYNRWVNIGMAIASQFGVSGYDKFDFISSFDSKYDSRTNSKHYSGFCDSIANGTSKKPATIGTFYYYCKEAGIDIYTEKTKSIINAVTVSKSQGSPSVYSVSKNVETQGHEITVEDEVIIQHLIDSKVDYSRLANAELKEIEILENFILQRFEPKYNEINQQLYVNEDILVTDKVMADIYLTCKKHLDLKKDLTERNVQLIMSSSSVTDFNPILNFFKEHYSDDCEKGLIEKYASCIEPYNEYNVWAFTKWIVGGVHNWTCAEDHPLICPHTFVATGQQHGVGKTSFLREVLPPELKSYFKDDTIDIKDKDSTFRLATSLIVCDDEFGGKSTKDDKQFKNLSAKDQITLRRPFQKFDITVRRRALLAGTTNENDILKDTTGNRRILPINFQGCKYDEMIAIDKVGLLCEAYYLLLKGYDWKIIGDDIKYLEENTTQNVAVIPFEEIFLNDFSLTDNGGQMIVINQGEILNFYNNKGLRITGFDIKNVMKKNKLTYNSHTFEGKRKSGIKVWVESVNPLYNNNIF